VRDGVAQDSVLPSRTREAVRDRIAQIHGSPSNPETRDKAEPTGFSEEELRREQLAIRFAELLAQGPHSLEDEFLVRLRESFSDIEIVDLTRLTAQYLAVGRCALALGLTETQAPSDAAGTFTASEADRARPKGDISPGLQTLLDGWDQRWSGVGELLTERTGIVFGEANLHRIVATMPVTGNRQPHGLLHGGASAVLAETVGSTAASLHAPEGHVASGVELNCSHHRSAASGHITAVCTPLHVGRTMSTFDIAITDDGGHRICTARLTCAIRPARAQSPLNASETGDKH
jgi:uncharacterized protein (TIGR00369 family)